MDDSKYSCNKNVQILKVYVLTSKATKISWYNYLPLYHLKYTTNEKNNIYSFLVIFIIN